jgi:Ca2+-binding RTX toxin-like protein
MAVSQSDVASLYLAYFGRPPDPGGLSFYTNNPSIDIWAVAAAFSASPESQSLFGTFGSAQINAIYQNLFNRDAEPDGLAYWTSEVNSGRLTPAGAAFAILLGAQNDDKIAVQNKLKVCLEFTGQLDTQAEINGYAGDIAAERAREFIHTVTSSGTTVLTAEALLTTQVGYATGQITLPFGATKDASNIVSFTNSGAKITVTEAAGSLVFTSSTGNGSATVSGTVAGINVPIATTLTISSTLAGSKAFGGQGTAVVLANSAGEDLSTTLTATGVDAVQLTSGKDYTLTTSQLAVARIGASGTLGNITDAGKMTVIGALDSVSGNGATALRAAGADTVVALLSASANIVGKSTDGVDRIDLAAGTYSMTDDQAILIGQASGTQTVKILNSASTNITLAATVEAFELSDFSGNAVTMGAIGQSITGGATADKVTAITGVTSTSDLKGGANVVIVTAGVDISKGSFNATGGSVSYDVDDATTATMTVAQSAAIGTAVGTQNITLGDKATALALRADIETYTLGNFTNSVTMGKVSQVVVGGTSADTVTAITGVTSTSDLKAGSNVVVVTNGADLSKGTFNATGGTVSFNVDAATTATLNAVEAAHIGSGTGTQTITISNVASGVHLAASIENFVLGNFANSVTLGAAAQNVTGGTANDTIATEALGASGTLDGAGGTGDVLSVGGTLGAATISNFEILNVSDDADISAANAGAALGTTTLTMAASTSLSLTVAQNEGLKTTATVSGSGQSITLLDAGSTKAIAGIETYVLSAGNSTIATSTAGQTINAGALADGDVLTLTGSTGVTVTLVAGDLDASGYTGSVTATATSGTNVIVTGSAADTITGGAGDDAITVGSGADVVIFKSLTGVDTLTDFAAGADKIDISKAVFTAFSTVGALAGTAFESGAGLTAAATASGHIVYDTTTGDLYYDADGSGGSAAVQIATLTGTPSITAANFVIIA